MAAPATAIHEAGALQVCDQIAQLACQVALMSEQS